MLTLVRHAEQVTFTSFELFVLEGMLRYWYSGAEVRESDSPSARGAVIDLPRSADEPA